MSDAAAPSAPLPLAADLRGCANSPASSFPLMALPPELLSLTFAKLDLGNLHAVSQAHPRLQEPARRACQNYRHPASGHRADV